MQGQMRKPRLRMISGGRDGLPERRRTPRRPEPGRVRLVFTRPVRQDDAAAPPDAPPPVRVPASRGQAASAPTQPAPVARRREEPRPAPVKAHRPGIDGALPVSIWIFALVALGGALLTILEGMALLGPGSWRWACRGSWRRRAGRFPPRSGGRPRSCRCAASSWSPWAWCSSAEPPRAVAPPGTVASCGVGGGSRPRSTVRHITPARAFPAHDGASRGSRA